MQFALIQDGKIKRIVSSSNKPAGFVQLPKGHQVIVGDEVAFFDERYARKSPQRCAEEGLIEMKDKEHVQLRWKGRWEVQADYTKEWYWSKSSGEFVRLKLGEEPTDDLTQVQKEDPEALWSEKDGWYVPQSVLDRRRAEEIEQELREKDVASIRALRASVLGKATEEDMSKLAEIESEVETLRAEKEALQKDSVVKG